MIKDLLPVGVVLERREDGNQWIDHSWHFIGVIAGAREVEDWVELAHGEGWVRYHVATLPLEIFGTETEGYKYNLSLEEPLVYAVLDTEVEGDREVEPSHVTVCPYEALDYIDTSDDDVVQNAPMPPEIAAWVADFVDRHHVDVPFRKRRQTPQPGKQEGTNELIPPPARRAPRGGNG